MTRVNFRCVTLCISSYLKILPLTRFAILGLLLHNSSASLAQSDDLDTNMAKDPRGLVESVTVPAFLPPNEYNRQFSEASEKRIFPIGIVPLNQPRDDTNDPRSRITALDIESYSEQLVEFSEQSRRDGNILWGRIEGTKYEQAAHDWIFTKLKEFGIEDVQYDKFPTYESIWFLSANSLEVLGAPGFADGQTFEVEDAITPFPSKNTPAGGVRAEHVYVGDGTLAELAGRDLTGKIVMVRGRAESSALFSSVRIAYSRIATGEWGTPTGFIVWWQLPGVKQVAGRVGAPGAGINSAKSCLASVLTTKTDTICANCLTESHQRIRSWYAWL